MARIRTIKPEFASSPDTARLSRDARLFFLQLLCQLDDEGRRPWLPKELAGLLYPHDDDVTAADITRWVTECASTPDPMLVTYEADGRWYICAPKFCTHQRIDRRVASKCPAPPPAPPESAECRDIAAECDDTVATSRRSVRGGSRKLEVGSRKSEIGRGKGEVGSASPRSADAPRGVPPPTHELTAIADGWCESLVEAMVANGCKPPKVTPAWREAAFALVQVDHRDPDEVGDLLEWCQSDDFWRSNIMSMSAFRSRYDRLRLDRERQSAKRARASPVSWHQASVNAAIAAAGEGARAVGAT